MIFPNYYSYFTFLGPKHELGPHRAEEHVDADFSAHGAKYWRTESTPHFQNWLAAIRSRKHEDLTADVEQGHLSASVCHLAKISCKLGRSLQIDPKSERFVGDPEADELLTREYRKPFVVPDTV